jgi:hypothetical protein
VLPSTPSGRDAAKHGPPIRFVVTGLADLESHHKHFATVGEIDQDFCRAPVSAGEDGSDALLEYLAVILVPERRSTR